MVIKESINWTDYGSFSFKIFSCVRVSHLIWSMLQRS